MLMECADAEYPRALQPESLAAVIDMCQEELRLEGSATLALAAVDADRDLLTLGHLGDAGYMVLRRGGFPHLQRHGIVRASAATIHGSPIRCCLPA